MKLSASLMCADWLHLSIELDRISELGFSYLHLDLIDSRFAPDLSMGSTIVGQIRSASAVPVEMHLMVEDPIKLIDNFEAKPEDVFTIHFEATRSLHKDLVRIRQEGWRVGVALSPATSPHNLDYVLEDVDFIQVMTVNPGFKGQPLVPQVLRKISDIRQKIENEGLPIELSVDGNVNPHTAAQMVSAGAETLVLGSSGYFRSDVSREEALDQMAGATKQYGFPI